MLMTYQKNQTIYEMEVKTPKSHSVFLYYILEASDNLCFYSTLERQGDPSFRSVKIQCTIEMKSVLQQVIQEIGNEIDLEVLSERQAPDSSEDFP